MTRPTSTLTGFGIAIGRAIDSYRCDSRSLFKKASLDLDALKNPNARYPDADVGKLIALAVKQTKDPGFGVGVARFVTPTTLHALGFSLLASENLHAALLRLVRYYRIVNEGVTIAVNTKKNDCELRIEVADQDSLPAEFTDAVLAIMVNVCRWLRGEDFSPERTLLKRSAPGQAIRFEEHFRSPIKYAADHNALVLDKPLLEIELPTSNPELAYQNDKIVADYLARFDSSRLSERVRTIFIERLVTGKFSEEQIAEQLNLSLRSLQRRLRDEQTSYQQLLDETRLDLALQYINRTSLTVAQIAPLLGFSDSSNFNRAFKRWLSISPSKYRALGFS